jgi:hypothetical protein
MIPSGRKGTIPIALLALVSALQSSLAQDDSRRSTPALVVDSFSRATRDGRWSEAARFVEAEWVVRERDEMVQQLRRPSPIRIVTADQLMRSDPEMPRAVAEYQVQAARKHIGDFDPLQSAYARVASVDELARLTPTEAAARYLEARDMRWQLHLAIERERRRGCALEDSVFTALEHKRPGATRILGAVIDDSIAYVLHEELPAPEDSARTRRRTARAARAATAGRGEFVPPPQLTTLRLRAGEWRILPGLDWSNGVAFASVQCERSPLGARRATPPSSP